MIRKMKRSGDEISSRIHQRLSFIYGSEVAKQVLPRIIALVRYYRDLIPLKKSGLDERDALLITYADSLLGDNVPIKELHTFLKCTDGVFSFVHLLPFYPYTSDDGFSVIDYRKVRKDLGTWEDIKSLDGDCRIVFDAVINHVSASSRYVQGYLQNEETFRDFCINLPPDTDTSSVLRTRNLPLLHDFALADGVRWLWTTFSRDQVDLNFSNPNVLLEILDVLLFYAEHGASMLRLDAIPYLWKKLGTSCAHLPETHEVIKLIRDVLDLAAPHVLLLTETNVPHLENMSYFGCDGDEAQIIYNFSLAPLIVWSFLKGNANTLSEWAKKIQWVSPQATYLNITATHDGIGMRPTEGILSEAERTEMVQMAIDRNGAVTGKRNPDGSVSPYELNLSYFDAINDPNHPESIECEVSRFLVSQAIPMAMIGIPGIYIHSLLGSRNNLQGVTMSGQARSINRPQHRVSDIESDLKHENSLTRLVFDGIIHLLKVRVAEPAFHPDSAQEILLLSPAIFALRRTANNGSSVLALHNVSRRCVEIDLPEEEANQMLRDLMTNRILPPATKVNLNPGTLLWLGYHR